VPSVTRSVAVLNVLPTPCAGVVAAASVEARAATTARRGAARERDAPTGATSESEEERTVAGFMFVARREVRRVMREATFFYLATCLALVAKCVAKKKVGTQLSAC